MPANASPGQVRMVLMPGTDRKANYGQIELGKIYNGPMVKLRFVNDTRTKIVFEVPDPNGPDGVFGDTAIIRVTEVG